MRTISSRQNPLVREFRSLAAAPDAGGTRLLLDGAHLLLAADEAGTAVDVVVVAASHLDRDTDEGQLARKFDRDGTDVAVVSDSVFAALSPVRSPSGIAALVRRVPTEAAAICATPAAFVLVLVDVQDPGNVGALLRTAEAGGVTGALVCGTSATPFSWKAVRGSMGSILRLPVAAGLSTDAALVCLERHQIGAVGAVARDGNDPDALNWTGRAALVLGGEGAGLGEETVRRCATTVTIPMARQVESLNVASAGAILIYAARRQRS